MHATTRRRPETTALLAAMALAGALAVGTARADDVLHVRDARARAGESGVPVLIAGTNDRPIHGFSLSVSYPSEAIRATSFDVQGTHVAGLRPDFVAGSIDGSSGVATLGVIFDYAEITVPTVLTPSAPSDPERLLARLLVDVRRDARGGTYPIAFADGAGRPAVVNRFTSAGESITPRLEDGSITIDDGNVLCVESRFAFPGASPNVPINVYTMHPEPLSGYQIAIKYDCSALELLEASLDGTSVAFELGRRGLVEFFQSDVDDTLGEDVCRSRTGVIFDYVEPIDGQTLSPSTTNLYDQSLLAMRFRVLASASASAQYQTLELHDIPGGLNNALIVDASSLDPRLIDGRIYFSTGRVRGFAVETESGETVPGAKVTLTPGNIETTTEVDGSFRFDDVPPGEYLVRLSKSGFYDEYIESLVITGGTAIDRWGDLAMYRIPAGGAQFRRGLANADGRADISDTVWLLNWLFKGGEPPVCLAAADINADGRADISDSIYLLTWLFGGGPPPPPPFESCGTDATSAALGCDTSPACP